MGRHAARTALGVLLLVAVFLGLVVSSASRLSATFDEPPHLASGYAALRWHDFRVNPEHPPLLKVWAALPLLWQPVWPQAVESASPDAKNSPSLRSLQTAWSKAVADGSMQWLFAHHLLYAPRDEALLRLGVDGPLQVPSTAKLTKADFHNDADRLLFSARLPMALLGALLALLVFAWAREWYGTTGGLLALALFCFDPGFIAHGGLVTTDVGGALFMFGAMYFLMRAFRKPSIPNVLATALFVGLALIAKYSGLLLVAWFVLALALGCWLPAPETRRRRLWLSAGILLSSALVAAALVWAAYGFRHSTVPDPARAARDEAPLVEEAILHRVPGHLSVEQMVRRGAAMRLLLASNPEGYSNQALSAAMETVQLPWLGRLLIWADQWHLAPEAYLYGLAYAEMSTVERHTYLQGQFSRKGFWYYFPVAFVLKTPLLTLLALGAALGYALVRRRAWRPELVFVWIPLAVYSVASLSSNLNIGHRHLLPLYPFLFVLCGGLGHFFDQLSFPTRPVALSAGLLAAAINSNLVFSPPSSPAVIFPNYLAYFNELAGGPRGGREHLVDSNLDWGQGLKQLRRWLDERGVREPVYLCYFGTADARYHLIEHYNLPGCYPLTPITSPDEVRVPAYFVLSATFLQGSYQSPRARQFWNEVLREATLVDVIGYSLYVYHRD